MMLIQEHKQYQDAPDGLYLLVDNSRTQDTFVGPSGTLIPPLTTGVVHSSVASPLTACALLMVLRSPAVSRTRPVFVPSGV